MRVQVLHRQHDLPKVLRRRPLHELLLLRQPIEHIPPLRQLHDEVEVLRVFEVVEQLDDVSVAELVHDEDFSLELGQHLGDFGLGDLFDCVDALGGFVQDAPDLAEGAVAEALFQGEVFEVEFGVFAAADAGGLEEVLSPLHCY